MTNVIFLPQRPARRSVLEKVIETPAPAPRRVAKRINTSIDEDVRRKAYATERLRDGIRIAVVVFGAEKVAAELCVTAGGLKLLAEREARHQ